MKKSELVLAIAPYRRALILMLLCLILLGGTGLAAAQKQEGGGCPLIDAIDDVPLAAPQPDPNCQSGQPLAPEDDEDDSLQLWATVASAGTVDDADGSMVNLTGPIATLHSFVLAPATLDMRYNVLAVDGLYRNGQFTTMRARFKDNGSAAQVIVRLKRHNLNTGTVSTLLTLDSDAFVSNTLYQTQSVSSGGCSSLVFDFSTYAYFIEVTITKSAAGGDPGLSAINIGNGGIC